MFRETAFLEPFEKITKETCIVQSLVLKVKSYSFSDVF